MIDLAKFWKNEAYSDVSIITKRDGLGEPETVIRAFSRILHSQ